MEFGRGSPASRDELAAPRLHLPTPPAIHEPRPTTVHRQPDVASEPRQAGLRLVPILGTVPVGREHYCGVLARHLDTVWRTHPPVYYALPSGRTSTYERVVTTAATTWTGVLLAGLEHLQRELGCSHVFVLLEDHVPLWPCDAEQIADIFRVAQREDLECVYFCKYAWPWHSTASSVDSAGRVRGWSTIDVVEIGGHRMARMPRNHLFYNQCQPAIWRLDSYVALLRAAVHQGVTDPWTLETLLVPGQQQHYVSTYRWPSRHCGYRRRGRVYLRSLYAIQLPEGRGLRDELLRERFPRLPPAARSALGVLFTAWGRLMGMPQRLDRQRVDPGSPLPST